jgi:hypothetical protein
VVGKTCRSAILKSSLDVSDFLGFLQFFPQLGEAALVSDLGSLVQHLARDTQIRDMDARLFEIFVSARQAVHRLTRFVIPALAADSMYGHVRRMAEAVAAGAGEVSSDCDAGHRGAFPDFGFRPLSGCPPTSLAAKVAFSCATDQLATLPLAYFEGC